MVPKIVTRLANIAAKMAGSDKYDSTVEPVTAFEYYLDKAADKILAIRGIPSVPVGADGLVLTADTDGVNWKASAGGEMLVLRCDLPTTELTTIPMTAEQVTLFNTIISYAQSNKAFTLFFNANQTSDFDELSVTVKDYNTDNATVRALYTEISVTTFGTPKLHIYQYVFDMAKNDGYTITTQLVLANVTLL